MATAHTVIDMKPMRPKISGLNYLEPTEITFRIKFEMPKAIAEGLGKNPILLQRAHDIAKKTYDVIVNEVVSRTKGADKIITDLAKVGKYSEADKVCRQLDNEIQKVFAAKQADAEKKIAALWAETINKKKEWKTFKMKLAMRCIVAGTGLGINTLAGVVCGAFTAGASSAFVIVDMCKSISTIALAVRDYKTDADKAVEALKAEIAKIEERADKDSIVRHEVSAAVLKAFLGFSQKSISTCREKVELVSAKHGEMVRELQRAGKKLNKIFDEQARLREQALAEAAKRGQLMPKAGKEGAKQFEKNLDRELKPAYKTVTDQIDKLKKLQADVDAYGKQVVELKAQMAEVEKKHDSKKLGVWRESMKALSVASLGMSGNGIGRTAQDISTGIGAAAKLYAADKILTKATGGTFLDAA